MKTSVIGAIVSIVVLLVLFIAATGGDDSKRPVPQTSSNQSIPTFKVQ